MSKSIIDSLELGRQRYVMAETVIQMVEGFRRDYMPNVRTWDAFALLLLLRKMLDQHMAGRAASASALSRSVGMPRTTVQRKLAQLKKIGAIEQHGSRFMVSPTYMNSPKMLQGFRRRLDFIRSAPKRISVSGS